MATASLNHRAIMHDLLHASRLEDRWNRITAHLAAIGMDQINYGILDSSFADRLAAPVHFLSTMDPGWIAFYGERKMEFDDPHVKLVRGKNITPYRWVESILPTYEDKAERKVLTLAAEAGLRSQLQVTLTGLDGTLTPVGGMAMGSSLGTELFRAIEGRELELITIAHLFHQRSIGEIRQRHHGSKPLSARERDCLSYIAQGLRIDRVAEKLGLARVTVELYLRGARNKLGAATLPEAVAKALYFHEITIA